jgi:hypothetical protein
MQTATILAFIVTISAATLSFVRSWLLIRATKMGHGKIWNERYSDVHIGFSMSTMNGNVLMKMTEIVEANLI